MPGNGKIGKTELTSSTESTLSEKSGSSDERKDLDHFCVEGTRLCGKKKLQRRN